LDVYSLEKNARRLLESRGVSPIVLCRLVRPVPVKGNRSTDAIEKHFPFPFANQTNGAAESTRRQASNCFTQRVSPAIHGEESDLTSKSITALVLGRSD